MWTEEVENIFQARETLDRRERDVRRRIPVRVEIWHRGSGLLSHEVILAETCTLLRPSHRISPEPKPLRSPPMRTRHLLPVSLLIFASTFQLGLPCLAAQPAERPWF